MLLDIVGAAVIGGVSLFGGRGSIVVALCGVAFLAVDLVPVDVQVHEAEGDPSEGGGVVDPDLGLPRPLPGRRERDVEELFPVG